MALVALILFLWLLVFGYLFGAGWTPTSRTLVQKMLSMAETKPGETVYDLGSGDGRIIITAAKDFHAKSIGVEINPLWVFWTQIRIYMLKLEEHVEVVWSDFFHEDLGKADVVTVFLRQDTNDRLGPKLEREMKQGSRVVSYTYPFTGWNPLKTDLKEEIFVYRISSDR